MLWTDFFKPIHLESNPNLHDTFWKAAKLCSACKVEVSAQHAQELMDAVEEIHNMFWAVKEEKYLGLEQADCMEKMQVTIRGDSM